MCRKINFVFYVVSLLQILPMKTNKLCPLTFIFIPLNRGGKETRKTWGKDLDIALAVKLASTTARLTTFLPVTFP